MKICKMELNFIEVSCSGHGLDSLLPAFPVSSRTEDLIPEWFSESVDKVEEKLDEE